MNKVYIRIWMVISLILIGKKKVAIRHVNLSDFQLIVKANEDVGRHIMLFKNFERNDADFFRTNIRANDVCFDVGGNIGFFSVLMATRASKGIVHVFEPIPMNTSIIQTNAHLNHLNNLTVNNLAVGDHEGVLKFSISSDSAFSSLRATGRKEEEQQIDVEMCTLDSYLEKTGIKRVDVLKIDVEGAEGLVIEGAENLLSDSARRPRLIMIELFNPNLLQFETNIQRVIDRMIGFGYLPSVHNGAGLVPYDVSMQNQFYNIFFLPFDQI